MYESTGGADGVARRRGVERGIRSSLERSFYSHSCTDAHACRLRQKLGADGDRYVINVWGVGYRLPGPPPPRDPPRPAPPARPPRLAGAAGAGAPQALRGGGAGEGGVTIPRACSLPSLLIPAALVRPRGRAAARA